MNYALKILMGLLLATALLAADSDATTAYWKAIAQRYAAEAAFERSLTPEQRQMRKAAEAAEAAITAARAKLAEACGKDSELDESGAEPVCKAKAK